MKTEQTTQPETKQTNPVVSFFRRWLFDDEKDNAQEKVNYTRILLVILSAWLVFWTVLPSISLANDFVDVLENIVWGRHFQFGFDKNPYAGAFFGVGVWQLSGKAFFSSFLASQVCVFIGIFSVYLVAKRIFPPRTAFLAAVTLLVINFYGIKATELCDDVMEHAVWPLTMLFVYLGVRGEEKNRWWYWLCAGFFAGLSLMVKYFAPAMYLCVGIPLLFTKEGRSMFRKPQFYLALIPFVLVILPNVFWLFAFGSKPFEYAAGRAGLGEGDAVSLADHFTRPLKALDRAAGVFGVAVIFFALFFPWRRKREDRPEYCAFDKVFVWSCCWGSLASALLFSLVTGGKINYSWLVPCFPFMGIWLFMVWSPRITRVKARAYTFAILLMGFVFGLIFMIRSLETQGYRKKGCDYENYPGHAVAKAAVGLWHTVSEDPLPFVVADRSGACSVAVYSPEAPEAFFCADVRQSQWVDPEEFFERGGVMIWDERDERHGAVAAMNKKLKNLPIERDGEIRPTPIPEERLGEVEEFTFDRAVPAWYRKLRGKPKPVKIYMRLILPEEAAVSPDPPPAPGKIDGSGVDHFFESVGEMSKSLPEERLDEFNRGIGMILFFEPEISDAYARLDGRTADEVFEMIERLKTEKPRMDTFRRELYEASLNEVLKSYPYESGRHQLLIEMERYGFFPWNAENVQSIDGMNAFEIRRAIEDIRRNEDPTTISQRPPVPKKN